ncbi:MAG: PEP-CTERM sorting domain-containing protein [Verrucomicrobia bacterium]|nr:PEP-CTERM sorting domain-containing protein [Verrucomicrobiota bacterium]
MKSFLTIGLLTAALGIQPVAGDLIGQIDTFDTGLRNWNSGANPTHVATGGPSGSGDGFLQVSRDASFRFHIAAFNKIQWTGNYLSAGITTADLVYVDDDTNSPAGSGGGSGSLADTLQNVNIIQIRHDYPTPTPPGSHPQHLAATLGIDNVQAVPEPSSLLYMLVATGGLMLKRVRRAARQNTDW